MRRAGCFSRRGCHGHVVLLVLAGALAPSIAAAQAADASDGTTATTTPGTHRVRPAVVMGFGYQPQASLDQRGAGRATEVGGGFTYNVAADIDVLPELRLGLQVLHTPWEMLHSVSVPADYPVARGSMTLVGGSVAGRLLLGTAVPLWLHVGAGGLRLRQNEYEDQPAVSTVDPAITMAAYFDFKTRWTPVTVRGGADDTYVFFGDESGFDRSHLVAFRLAVAYSF